MMPPCYDQRPGKGFTQNRDPQNNADALLEGRRGPNPRRPEVAERRDEQDEADAVSEEAEDALRQICRRDRAGTTCPGCQRQAEVDRSGRRCP